MVFILIFGAGISCWGNFSATASVSVVFDAWEVDFCMGGGGIGAGGGADGGDGILGGGGGGGGRAGPKKY